MFRGLCVEGHDYGEIPPYLKAYAEDIVRLRLEANRENYRNKPQKERPGTKNSLLLGEVSRDYYTDYAGILGELIVRRYFEVDPRFVYFTAQTMIQTRGSDGSDIEVRMVDTPEDLKVNVKSGEGTLKANKRAVDIGDCNMYIFIQFLSENTFAPYKFSQEDIQRWEVKHAYSAYYNLKV